jgi:hypothetical protein
MKAFVRGHGPKPSSLGDMDRLLLEDVCSDLVRFLHSRGDPTRFGAVLIDREGPLDYARLQSIGDCLHVCNRLLALAEQHQIVISNILRQALHGSGYEFAAMPPFEARHIGVLQPWRLLPCPAADSDPAA